ncbi:hypothetical protein C487_03593 [Natrinema pallidum DSM 3751]|uniref:Uncharacterized protein n=1 Tax=Natrinema pallidum DSM 3751 TaxID=1227495 RepID=L9Z5F3_9EURY|nr:hypothetical protein C487_03593 [Natrinema pallidum DSM 3751]
MPDWLPERFEDTHRTTVIADDHVPSYRAFLFTESDAMSPSSRTDRSSSGPFGGRPNPPGNSLLPSPSSGHGRAESRTALTVRSADWRLPIGPGFFVGGCGMAQPER